MGVGGQRHAPPALPTGKTRYPLTGGWVGPRADLDGCRKSRPPPGFDPRTVQSVASRYTDWDIAGQLSFQYEDGNDVWTSSRFKLIKIKLPVLNTTKLSFQITSVYIVYRNHQVDLKNIGSYRIENTVFSLYTEIFAVHFESIMKWVNKLCG